VIRIPKNLGIMAVRKQNKSVPEVKISMKHFTINKFKTKIRAI
jgi:hypothetical protein